MSATSLGEELHSPFPAPPPHRASVVFCDDEASIRKLYRRALRSYDVDLFDAVDGEECLAHVARLLPDLVVLDLTLPGRTGFEVLPEICALSPRTQVVVVSGMVTEAVVQTALGLGATACVEKVQFVPQLRTLVRELQR